MAEVEAERVITVTGERQVQFSNYLEVAAYLGRRLSGRFSVSEPLGKPLTGRLEREDGEGARVVLNSGDKKVSYPRGESGLGVSTASVLDLDIIVHPEDWDSDLLDRGLEWISVSSDNPESARIHLITRTEHEVDETEIAERLETAIGRARELVDAALSESAELPWAAHSSRSLEVIAADQAEYVARMEARHQRALQN